jgi:hypothetical protein
VNPPLLERILGPWLRGGVRLTFRDALRADPALRDEYQELVRVMGGAVWAPRRLTPTLSLVATMVPAVALREPRTRNRIGR